MSAQAIPRISDISAQVEGTDGFERVIEHIHVQVAIAVIVEKRCVGAEAAVGQPVFRRALGKGNPSPIVDKKFVFPAELMAVFFIGSWVAGIAHINIEPAVAISC